MFNSIRIFGMAAVLAAVPALVSAASVRVYDVSSGSSLVMDTGDSGALTGRTAIGSTSGGMTFNITVTPMDNPGMSLLNTIGITTSGAGAILVYVTEDDFEGGAGGITPTNLKLSVTSTAVGKTLASNGWVDDGNGLFGMATKIGASNIVLNNAVAGIKTGERSLTTGLTGPFSMTTAFVIRHDDATDITSFDATQIATVPVPAAGLLLLTALGGLGIARRRRKAADQRLRNAIHWKSGPSGPFSFAATKAVIRCRGQGLAAASSPCAGTAVGKG